MMNKLLLTTHWRAEDVELVLAFLNELSEVIRSGYREELNALYESYRKNDTSQDDNLDLFADDIPF